MSGDAHDKLARMMEAGALEPYLRYIRFPRFKNIREDTQINFDHPVTALVGPNGTNKTAILRAIQGCPDYENLGNYWFSTSLDPISDEDRHRFIHGYFAKSAGQIVEVVKTRIKRDKNPDYFEPSRPLIVDGMERMPPLVEGKGVPADRVQTRWKAIRKKVEYLDFRSELSAYDKFFFHSAPNLGGASVGERKNRVRKRAARMVLALGDGRRSDNWFQMQRILKPARFASEEQVKVISEILGRVYTSIEVLEHRYFNVEGATVRLKTNDLEYSEAFAGSGEFAVARLVMKVMEAEDRSLILLDEPEVSLHPGAQRNLMSFLADQAKLKKHQIILSTHAPEIIRDLPPSAIKVLHSNENDGRVELVAQRSDPSEAFFRLGVNLQKAKTIYVEDLLAVAIVKKAMRPLGQAANIQVEILPLPGGASGIRTKFIPSFALARKSDSLVLLDGDQRPDIDCPEPDEIQEANLEETANKIAGGEVRIFPDGHKGDSSAASKSAQLRLVLEWYRLNVDYLPGMVPEELLVEMAGESLGDVDAKVYWKHRTRSSLGLEEWEAVTASEILAEQRRELAKVDDDCAELATIRSRVQNFLEGR
ncbi:AAA family ATPase [Amycolatopsis sp. NPDC024027]|uniref:ATP-dependent nuclease n=1 Tax=Amycolatopsis sp. NPDC024027 TaxID=3154327 RepID=UPI0033C20BCC